MKENLSLSWDAHQKNICSGLSLLQQQGEFVDMTLAADGHHVKVHQMIMSLASPYIKALITTAQCPHPVIFLNNISHKTLISILEYVYTGEVHITRDELPDLIVAGKALHIRGLREMDTAAQPKDGKESNPLEDTRTSFKKIKKGTVTPMCKVYIDSNDGCNDDVEMKNESIDVETEDNDNENFTSQTIHSLETNKKEVLSNPTDINYTISTHGNLQLIVNRYIYNLKYVQKNRSKYWRCVEYASRKCPASIYTSDSDKVLRRKCTHNHPFHDSKILNKIRNGIVYKGFNEAKSRAVNKMLDETVEVITSPTEQKIDDSE